MARPYHIIVKLAVSPKTASGWLAKAKGIRSATGNNAALFASIVALLARLAADTDALDQAQAVAANRSRSDIEQRNAALRTLKTTVYAVVTGVQGLCDAAPDAEHAIAIAAAAGLGVRRPPVHHTPDFYGKALGTGRVKLYARLPVKKGTVSVYFEWETSTDGGASWTLHGTNKSSTLVSGLTPCTWVSFRYRTTVKNVPSDWSQTISIVVR